MMESCAVGNYIILIRLIVNVTYNTYNFKIYTLILKSKKDRIKLTIWCCHVLCYLSSDIALGMCISEMEKT